MFSSVNMVNKWVNFTISANNLVGIVANIPRESVDLRGFVDIKTGASGPGQISKSWRLVETCSTRLKRLRNTLFF